MIEISISYGLFVDCPICSFQLVERKCRNGCFEDHDTYVMIFGEFISLHDASSVGIISRLIMYWRENDRYLVELMK